MGVTLLTSTRAAGINDEDILLTRSGGKSIYTTVYSVILATGSVSRNELVDEVNGLVCELYVIGDASRPRNAFFAIREGAELGRKI